MRNSHSCILPFILSFGCAITSVTGYNRGRLLLLLFLLLLLLLLFLLLSLLLLLFSGSGMAVNPHRRPAFWQVFRKINCGQNSVKNNNNNDNINIKNQNRKPLKRSGRICRASTTGGVISILSYNLSHSFSIPYPHVCVCLHACVRVFWALYLSF